MSVDRETALKIHNSGERKNKPFVSYDCALEKDKLFMESELFGHERGSFPGAFTRKIGLLEIANGGSFHLQNPRFLSKKAQKKLKDLIINGTLTRLGGTEVPNINLILIFYVEESK